MSLRAELSSGRPFELATDETDPREFIRRGLTGEPGDVWVEVKDGSVLNMVHVARVYNLGPPVFDGPVDQGVDWEDLAISVQMAVAARFTEMRKTGRDLTNIDDEEAEISSVVLTAVRDYFARD